MTDKLWICNEVTDECVKKLSIAAQIPALLAKVFLSRGINDADYVKKFLNPSLSDLHDPFMLNDMHKAVDRIIKAIQNKEKIVVYGDYDVDGVTSTSILLDFLNKQGACVEFYIPDRAEEGYGLSNAGIDKVLIKGVDLIITVDCGVTAIEEVQYINSHGAQIIITDHHECKDVLPPAYAVVNPCRHDSTYPFKELAGVGVSFKLISAICIKMGLGQLYMDYLDLVALGTIADIVPLIGENRVIVKHGIEKIEKTSNLGLKTLIDNSGLKDKQITSWNVAFALAPRINAAGRIGDAGRAVKLFTTSDEQQALSIVLGLNEENKYRQDTETEIFRQVVETIESNEDLKRQKVLVVSGNTWHHGIIGIVASKISEKYYRPCILISVEGDVGKSSGRSIEGFDMFKALVHCEELFEKYGGHELAAGFTINPKNIQELREKINSYADAVLDEYILIPKVKIDAYIKSDDISLQSVKKLDMLAPFGAGNSGPVFAYNKLKIKDSRAVGADNKHLKLVFEDNTLRLDAIGFNMGGLLDTFNNAEVDVAGVLEINAWNNTEKVQINLKDIKLNEEEAIEDNYFCSLDKCKEFHLSVYNTANSDVLDIKHLRNIGNDLVNLLQEMSHNVKRIAILINSLEDSKRIKEILRKSILYIKKPHKICYTKCNNVDDGIIYVIINPHPEEVELNFFDVVIFYGTWTNRGYLSSLARKVNEKKVLLCYEGIQTFKVDEIVPEREDLSAVYRYIKLNHTTSFRAENLIVHARKITQGYNVKMNYFKLKRSIEILEELELLKKEHISELGMLITMGQSTRQKAELENSLLYRNMQVLKSQKCWGEI